MRKLILSIFALAAVGLCASENYYIGAVSDPGDVTPPVVSSITGENNGTVTVVLDEVVTVNDGTGFTWDVAGGNQTMVYQSGSGSDTLIYKVLDGGFVTGTANVDYATVANGIEDAAGNDLASFTDTSATNNSQWTYTTGFEGVGAPTGFTEDTSVVDFDATTGALVDSESMEVLDDAGNGAVARHSFTQTSQIFIGFRIRPAATTASTDTNGTFKFWNGGTTVGLVLWSAVDNNLNARAQGGSTSSDTAISMTGTNEYWIMVEHDSTGASGSIITRISISDDAGASWDSTVSSTNGTTTNDPDTFDIRVDDATDATLRVDSFVSSSSTFNPEDIP